MHSITLTSVAFAATLFLTACGGSDNSSDVGGGGSFSTSVAVKHAVTGNPALEAALKRCIYQPIRDGSGDYCRLNQLSLIADIRPGAPTVEDIMSRALISHDWMGTRLRQVLYAMPAESLALFNAVTGIVVASDLRPSFYNRGTAAIYIDPYYLFITEQEKDTVDSAEDFRSGFDDDLQYDVFFRYMLGSERAYRFFPPNGQSRSNDEQKYIFSRLIFHELAHANDFQPPARHASVDRGRTALENANAHQSSWISNNDGYDLSSATLFEMARVKFRGQSPNAQQRSLTAHDIAGHIDPEPANHDYQYFSQFEDVAMLTEAALMDYFYGVEFESAVLERPNHVIRWGKRKRIAKANVKEKSRAILQRMLPQTDFSAFFAALTTEEDLPHGRTWQETNSASSSSSLTFTSADDGADQDPFIY